MHLTILGISFSSSKSTVSKVESVSTYFKKKSTQAQSPIQTNKTSTNTTEDNSAQEPDSPYKNLIKSEIKVNLDDSTEDAADFKSPVLIRKPNNLQLNKPSQIGGQKSKAPVKRRNKQSSKKSASKNYTIKIIEDNFKLFGDKPEQMQMAIALSKSSYEAEHGCQSPSKEEMSDVGELLRTSRPTFLERFGFKSDKSEKRKATEGNTKIRNRFKYITPILNIRTNDERESLIESKISLILSHGSLKPKKLFEQTINSTLLKNYVSKEKSIFKLDQIYEKNNFYVHSLNIPRDTTKCGSMLKSWDSIHGRDKSPCKNKTNSSPELTKKEIIRTGDDSVKSFLQPLTSCPEMFSNDKASSLLLTDDAECFNSYTNNTEETVTAVTQTTSLEKPNTEEKQGHIKTPVKHLTDTLDVGVCCSLTTLSRTPQVNVGSFESESKDSAITNSLSSSSRLTVPSFSSSMRCISPDLFASDEEFRDQITVDTESNAYFHSITSGNCKDTEEKQCFVDDIDARAAVKNLFDSEPSQAFVLCNIDNPKNCSFNKVIELTDDDETINKALDNTQKHVNDLDNTDLIQKDPIELDIVENNASLEEDESNIVNDSFKSTSNDSHLENNRHCEPVDDKLINVMEDNDTIKFSNKIINDGGELLDECNHNALVVEDNGNNTNENEIIDLTDDDDSFSQNLNKCLLPDKKITKNDTENSDISGISEKKAKRKTGKRKTDIYSLKEFEIGMEFEAENEETVRDISAIGNRRVEINREYVKILKNKYKKDASMENDGNEDASLTDNKEKGTSEINLINICRTSDNINCFKEPETIEGNSSGSLESPSKRSTLSSESCIYDNLSDSSLNIIDKGTDAVQGPDASTSQSISYKDPSNKNESYSMISSEKGQQEDYCDNENLILEDVPKVCQQTEWSYSDEPILYESDNLSNNSSKSSRGKISSPSPDKNHSCHGFDNIADLQENEYRDNKNSSLDETPKRSQRSKSPFFDEPVLYDSVKLNVTDYVINMLNQENFSFDKTKKSIDGRYTNIGNIDLDDDDETPSSQESQTSVIADEELNYSCHFATPSKIDKLGNKELNNFEMEDARPLSPENEPPIFLDSSPCQNTRNTEMVSKPTTTKSVSTPDNFIIKTDNITPMPDYDQMGTPLINNELQKYGVKPLKRTRGTKLLKYIYESTHPLVTSDQHVFGASESDEDKRIIKRRKKDDHSSSSSMQAESLKLMNSAASVGLGCVPLLEIVGDKIIKNEKLEDLIFERRQSVKIPSCKVPLQIVWHNLVSSHPEIKENILLYEPLQLESLHVMIKEQGYKFHIQDLLTFLDKKCVTIRTAQKQGKAHR